MSGVKKIWMDFLSDESGMGVVEIILIIVVLIAMVLVFKEQITTLQRYFLRKTPIYTFETFSTSCGRLRN